MLLHTIQPFIGEIELSMKRICQFFGVWASFCELVVAATQGVSLVEAPRKIWDAAPHNAFTDLAYWNGQFVCAFREGRSHVSTDGKIRVLSSRWQ